MILRKELGEKFQEQLIITREYDLNVFRINVLYIAFTEMVSQLTVSLLTRVILLTFNLILEKHKQRTNHLLHFSSSSIC